MAITVFTKNIRPNKPDQLVQTRIKLQLFTQPEQIRHINRYSDLGMRTLRFYRSEILGNYDKKFANMELNAQTKHCLATCEK